MTGRGNPSSKKGASLRALNYDHGFLAAFRGGQNGKHTSRRTLKLATRPRTLLEGAGGGHTAQRTRRRRRTHPHPYPHVSPSSLLPVHKFYLTQAWAQPKNEDHGTIKVIDVFKSTVRHFLV